MRPTSTGIRIGIMNLFNAGHCVVRIQLKCEDEKSNTMKTTRRQFLQASVIASLPSVQTAFGIDGVVQAELAPEIEALDAFAIASKHVISREIAGPTYFEGMLLGNGDVGVCAVVRPDALGIHISKSDCWDIRVSEDSEKDVVPFAEILKMWQRASDEAKQNGNPNLSNLESAVASFREYSEKVGSSYSKPWPRPWPCGTVWLKWDPRWVEAGRYTLDPSNGLFTLELESTDLAGIDRVVQLTAFVDWDSGLVSVRSSAPVDLISVIYMPQMDGFHAGPFDLGHSDTKPGQLPAPEVNHQADDTFAEFSCFQFFPSVGPTTEQPISPKSDKDRNFSLCGRIAGKWTRSEKGIAKEVSFTPNESQTIRLDVIVATPRDLLLKRLLYEGNADPAVEPSLSISQFHTYDREDLETLAYTNAQIAALSRIEFSQLQQSSES